MPLRVPALSVVATLSTGSPTTSICGCQRVGDGAPYLVPLSFDWDGEALLIATPATVLPAGTGAATRMVRLGLGHTRDVSMIEGDVDVLEIDALPQEQGDAFAERSGFDPRTLTTPYRWFRISPRRIQAWREVDELNDRELMRDGRWLDTELETR